MNSIKSVKYEAKYWWVSLLLGIIGIGLGVVSTTSPTEILSAMTFVF
ncbi:hypothetical protein CLV62_14325 [Dysgonomonas alginatilytica]|uniref:Uncharacterized protein n=1 Tax=Dysgonomonas alginatilytica TaxID=1605892 RepID=A0A2V3PHU8_9BACT|nr:hypothetical protein CLV62_14325 [Dysgonomonas alginatilytica]